jgi:hypothetical protein
VCRRRRLSVRSSLQHRTQAARAPGSAMPQVGWRPRLPDSHTACVKTSPSRASAGALDPFASLHTAPLSTASSCPAGEVEAMVRKISSLEHRAAQAAPQRLEPVGVDRQWNRCRRLRGGLGGGGGGGLTTACVGVCPVKMELYCHTPWTARPRTTRALPTRQLVDRRLAVPHPGIGCCPPAL